MSSDSSERGRISFPPIPVNEIVAFESTPLMVEDVLYFATQTGQAVALDSETGRQLWVFDPFSEVGPAVARL